MLTLIVQLGDRSYPIVVTHDPGDALQALVRERARDRTAFLVTDRNVRPHAENVNRILQAVRFATRLMVIPPGEEQKCLAAAANLYDALAEMPADRQTLVVAIGGGVVGDLAGFVAATYNRGLPLFMVPTTLLAMVDSSVGGKVAVNHPRGKNLIGAFHQPVAVWIDVGILATLPEREYRSGLAEVVKYGVILDPDFFAYLEEHVPPLLARDPEVVEHVVLRCCTLKAGVVAQDERETSGRRAILNYGHTFAHAFENTAGYGAWLHGEAVAAGMTCAGRLAQRLGLLDANAVDRQARLLERLGLPIAIPATWPATALMDAMRSDKKALGRKIRFVLPTKLGECALVDGVAEEQVVAVLKEARQ